MTPKVNAIVDLLVEKAPDVIADLRKRYPEQARLFESLTLGAEEPSAAPNYVFCELLQAGIPVARRESERLIEATKNNARNGKRLRLGGSIVTSVLSASALLTLLFGAPTVAAISAGGSLLASLVGLMAAYLESPLFGSITPTQVIEECFKCEVEIDRLALTLKEANADALPCHAEVTKLQEISAQLKKLSIYAGVDRDAHD